MLESGMCSNIEYITIEPPTSATSGYDIWRYSVATMNHFVIKIKLSRISENIYYESNMVT